MALVWTSYVYGTTSYVGASADMNVVNASNMTGNTPTTYGYWTSTTSADQTGQAAGVFRVYQAQPSTGWSNVTEVEIGVLTQYSTTQGTHRMYAGMRYINSDVSRLVYIQTEPTSSTWLTYSLAPYESTGWDILNYQLAGVLGNRTDSGIWCYPFTSGYASTQTMRVYALRIRIQYDDSPGPSFTRDGIAGADMDTLDGVAAADVSKADGVDA